MADLLRKTKSLYASTANTFGTGTSVTITPSSVSGLPTDTEITLTFDRVDSTGAATPTKMERIIGTISGGNFVVRTSPSTGRGADGTSDAAHTSPVVEYIPNAKDVNDMIDCILAQHSQAGAHSTTYVVTPTATQTLTNKRNTKRVDSQASTDTITPEPSTYDKFVRTAQAHALVINNHSTSTPTDGELMLFELICDGTPRALTYGDKYLAKAGTALPTTLVASKKTRMLFEWSAASSGWDLLAVGQE